MYDNEKLSVPLWDSQVLSSAVFVGGGLSFLQQTWFSDWHSAVSALIKTPSWIILDVSLPFNLSKHFPFSTHLKPSFLNSGSKHFLMMFFSLQHTPSSGHIPNSALAWIREKSSLIVRVFCWHLPLDTHL